MASLICQPVATTKLQQIAKPWTPREREIIEVGPPEDIVKVFKELFTDKIASTKIACTKARKELGWPRR